jgi:NAD-dependent DNA ligase
MSNNTFKVIDIDEERFIQLSWEILEHKCKYYSISNIIAPVSDTEYDVLETEYRELADKLGHEATAANMVGFDEERPSCALVKARLLRKQK